MKPDIDIIEAIKSEGLFRPLFKDLDTWRNWMVYLKALFALDMTRTERKIYKKYTGRSRPPSEPFREAYAIVGRRGGKSFISAVIACYLALFHDWKPHLSRGESGWIMTIASDRQQARVILGYIKGILELPIFSKEVDAILSDEVRLRNGINISIKTSDYRSLRGFSIVAAICDELAFWRSEGENPSEEILTALRPALATVPGSILMGISTPYARSGPLYEAYAKHYGKNSDTLVWNAETLAMNPTIPRKIVKRGLAEDYAGGKAEWLAEFRSDVSSYLPADAINAVIRKGMRLRTPQPGVYYYAFVDPSGGVDSKNADSFTLAICHRGQDTGKVLLDRIEERTPPFAPREIAREFAEILKQYAVDYVTGDRYAGAWPASAFRDHGVEYYPSELNKSQIYLEAEALVAQQAVELLDNKKLRIQLCSLERRVRSGGNDQVDHPRGGHDDIANAAMGAILLPDYSGVVEDAQIEWLDLWGTDHLAGEREAVVRRLNG